MISHIISLLYCCCRGRQWLQPDEINPLFLWFRDKSWEKPYVREHDPLFKFYVFAAFVVLLATGAILLLTEKQLGVVGNAATYMSNSDIRSNGSA